MNTKHLLSALLLLSMALWAPSVAFAADGDGDGVEDGADNCPTEANGDQLDGDQDGVGDSCDSCPGLFNTEQDDNDQDGVGDGCDGCPDDPGKIEPGACGCDESDTDSDSDGSEDCIDGCPDDPDKISGGLCGCGEADTNDSDNDGSADCLDACPNDPSKSIPGLCGCGVADTDSDNDGSANCFDLCPADPGKTAPGACGCGSSDRNDDNDGLPACDDNCPDEPNTGQLDEDGDGVGDECDNCFLTANANQADTDGDGTGNACDACPADPRKVAPGSCGCGTPDNDPDGDSQGACNDNCPLVNNPDQDDSDGDGAGDACDNCPGLFNSDQDDSDGDGIGDDCEACPLDPDKAAPGQCGCGVAETDGDGDGSADCVDNCEADANADQDDADGDGFGDVCDDCASDPIKSEAGQCGCGVADTDSDGDGTADCADNCPTVVNTTQADNDGDGAGDLCDGCPADPDKGDEGQCGCGVEDSDGDGDGSADCTDNCASDANSDQSDADGDGAGDVCDGCPDDVDKTSAGVCGCGVSDGDGDGDGVSDCADNCPAEANANQADTDNDGDGDVCDDFICPGPGEVQGAEVCDGSDNDCDGQVDNGASCPPGTECQAGACQAGLPDFSVVTSDIFIEDRDIDVGELFTIQAEIRNNGAVDGVNVGVNLLDMGFVVRSTTIDFLPAGASASVEFELSFDEASLRIAQVRVDPDDFFDELDEENNNATQIVRVGQPPAGFNGRLVVESGDVATCFDQEDLHIGGKAYYEFEDEGVVFTFPVQGGLVTLTLDGRVFTTHTNVHGNFLFHEVPVPSGSGNYPADIEVSDSDIVGSTQIIVQVTDQSCSGGGHDGGAGSEDIWVYSHDIVFEPTNRPRLGETLEITSTIHHNLGTPRADIPVTVFAHHPDGGQLVRQTLGVGKVDFVSGGPEQQDFKVSWTNDDEGVYIIQTVVAPNFAQHTGNDAATRLVVVGDYKHYPADITLSPDPFNRLCDSTLTGIIQLPADVDVETIDFTGAGVYIAEPPELADVDGDGTQLIRAIADTAVFGDHDGDGTADVMVSFSAPAFAAATPEIGPKLIQVVGFMTNGDAFSGVYTIDLITQDADEDGVGDACDVCPDDFNPSQSPDACDDGGDDTIGPDDDDDEDDDDTMGPGDDDDDDEDEDGRGSPNPNCASVGPVVPSGSALFGLFGLMIAMLLIARRRSDG